MNDFKANECFSKLGPTSLAKKVDVYMRIVTQKPESIFLLLSTGLNRNYFSFNTFILCYF